MSESEVTIFYKWLYDMVKNHDLATLGPFRFVKEHKEHKRMIISPDQFLPKMAKRMEESTGVPVSLESVAADFNELIDTGYISEWIGLTNKRIALDVIQQNKTKHENNA